MDKKLHQRRYRLHQKVKSLVTLQSRQRTMHVPISYQCTNKYMLEIINRFKYNLQFQIPQTNDIQ